jgi:hypothetical protein
MNKKYRGGIYASQIIEPVPSHEEMERIYQDPDIRGGNILDQSADIRQLAYARPWQKFYCHADSALGGHSGNPSQVRRRRVPANLLLKACRSDCVASKQGCPPQRLRDARKKSAIALR